MPSNQIDGMVHAQTARPPHQKNPLHSLAANAVTGKGGLGIKVDLTGRGGRLKTGGIGKSVRNADSHAPDAFR